MGQAGVGKAAFGRMVCGVVSESKRLKLAGGRGGDLRWKESIGKSWDEVRQAYERHGGRQGPGGRHGPVSDCLHDFVTRPVLVMVAE